MSTRCGSLLLVVLASTFNSVRPPTAHAQVQGVWAQPDDNIFPSLVIASSTIRPEKLRAMQAALSPAPRNAVQPQGENDSGKAATILKALSDGLRQKQSNAEVQTQLGNGMTGLETLGVTVKTVKPHTRVRLTIKATKFFEESSSDDMLERAGVTSPVWPDIKWNFKELAENDQQVPLGVVFKVRLDDEEEKEFVKTITVRSIRDCPSGWRAQFADSAPVNVSWMFAAYVNEDHPWIDSILRETIEQGIVESFVGQQWGPDKAMQQVFALWHTLQRRGFQYSSITTTPGASGRVFSQTVRTFEDSLATAQGNCIDGTAVFASLLRKIGIEPFIVLVPGHAFLAFRVDDGAKFQIYGLETTMVGHTNIRSETDVNKANFSSAVSFAAAVAAGTKKLADAAKLVESGKSNQGYSILPLAAIRDVGIAPLPSRASRALTLPALSAKALQKQDSQAIPLISVSGSVKFSLDCSTRNAMTGPGLVLSIRNKYPVSIPATVSKLDAQGRAVKAVPITLRAQERGEVGHLEGISWTVGDLFLIEASGYEPYRGILNK